jgi:ferredoxin-type protein NapH
MYLPYRRAAQLSVVVLMFVVPILNIYEMYAITGTFYAINFGGLGVADPSVILQAIFAAGELTIPLLTAAIFPIFVAILLGRFWCGWLCPYLLAAECIDWLRNHLYTGILKRPLTSSSVIKGSFTANLCRYSFLIVGTALAGAIGIPLLNYINAPGIMSAEAMIFVKERTVSLEFWFIVILLALQLTMLPKIWCRLFCPTGSVLALFRIPVTMRVSSNSKNPATPCCKENSCTAVCPMGLEPYQEAGNLLCVNCGKCIDSCRFNRLKLTGFEVNRPHR